MKNNDFAVMNSSDIPEPAPDYLRAGHAACPGCGLAIGMKLVFQAMGPRIIAVIVPSCEGSIGGVYPVTAYGVSTFHSAFEIAAPTAAGTCAAGFFASTGANARLAPSRTAAMSRPNIAAGNRPTLVSAE